ncbi:MAG: lysoplasmalogenase [Verrucomicrobia bacterium]|nr:lysoplasmalogenase [Verrucomicrobiota bacterium]
MHGIFPRPVFISLAIALSGGLTIFARNVELGGLSLGYVFMPLTTLLILLLAATAPQSSCPRYQWSVVAGLLFSLAGDVCLMLPKDLFLAGLLAFLVAHMCYLVAFTADCRFASRLVPFAVWGGIGLVVLVVLWARLPAALRLPVVLYAGALLAMAAQAASRAVELRAVPATAAAIGAGLFVVSDTLLASNRFGGDLPASRLLVLGTYFTAQWLIARSVYQRRSAVGVP